MSRTLRIAAIQAAPRNIGASIDEFSDEVQDLVSRTGAQLVVYPELHLFGTPAGLSVDAMNAALRESTVTLDSPFTRALGAIAKQHNIWFVPGSICEVGPHGEFYNTAPVFSPSGELVTFYRKIFPWRPSEPFTPGGEFSTFDIPGVGRVGLSICYDSWFPEVTRQLGWMGTELVLNVVKTTTPDRGQELVLARANSIVNQTFTVSVNCAAPVGVGLSLVVDPEGRVLEETFDAEPAELVTTIDFSEVERVRREGTAGVNRMWSQFHEGEPAIALPVYDGRIEPHDWAPPSFPFEQ